MKVQISVGNTECKILTRLNKDQLVVISGECMFQVEGSEFKANAFRNGASGRGRSKFTWDGYKRLFNVQTQKFPIGLLNKIIGLFGRFGIEVELLDHRSRLPRMHNWSVSNCQEREYQNGAVINSLMYGNGIVKAATGSGKTTIGAKTIAGIGKNSVFIVHTKDLLYQTKESFERLLGTEIGQIGDGIVNLKPITIATVQTLALVADIEYERYKYDEDFGSDEKTIDKSMIDKIEIMKWARTVGLVIFDEVHRVGSRTAYAARFMFVNADNAYGYSASPWRDDGSDLMVEAAFGHRIVDITASELIRSGHLVRPTIIVKTLSQSPWSGKTYEQIYKSSVVENVFRNMQVTEDAYNEYNRGRNTLVLVTQIKHGESLENMLRSRGAPAVFISGKSGTKKRQSVIGDMRSGRAPIVIASTIADVGLDVPRLQSLVEAGAGKSSVTALQRLGRIMRPFTYEDGVIKNDCIFITYHDKVPYLVDHIDKKIDIWSTEPEFNIVRL